MDLVIVIVISYPAQVYIFLFLMYLALFVLTEYIADLYGSFRDGYVLSL